MAMINFAEAEVYSMADQALVLKENDHPLVWWKSGDKQIDFRIDTFVRWQRQVGDRWYQPDLARWRDDLLAEQRLPDGTTRSRSAATVAAYLGTVRGLYNRLINSNDVRDLIYQMTDPAAPPDVRKAFVDEMLIRLHNAVHPTASPVAMTKVQDISDSKHRRLTIAQANSLMEAPGRATMMGIRDTALIALLLCTGIREDELCRLDVPDLRDSMGGELALRIRRGKGNKERLVPYGDLDWCLVLVEDWMQQAGIRSGAVFRGLNKAQRPRSGRLTTRSVQYIVLRYPVIIDGRSQQVRPHDCRRSYARLLYDNGMDLLSIMQNLGHSDLKTTERYIGTLDAARRRPAGFLHYNL